MAEIPLAALEPSVFIVTFGTLGLLIVSSLKKKAFMQPFKFIGGRYHPEKTLIASSLCLIFSGLLLGIMLLSPPTSLRFWSLLPTFSLFFSLGIVILCMESFVLIIRLVGVGVEEVP